MKHENSGVLLTQDRENRAGDRAQSPTVFVMVISYFLKRKKAIHFLMFEIVHNHFKNPERTVKSRF